MKWPTRCLLCQGWGSRAVCEPCRLRLAPDARTRPRCSGCGAVLALGAARCSDCVRNPPPQTGTVVAVDYGHPWDRLILELKYGARPEIAPALADLLAGAVRDAGGAELVVPIPLSAGRLRRR